MARGDKMAINFADLSSKEAPRIITEIPGPKSKFIIEQDMMLDSNYVSYPRTLPIALEEGNGATIKDVDGNTYIDLFAGMGVMNFGYSNPYIMQYVREQQDKLTHCLDFPTPLRLKLLQKLNEVAPLGLRDNCKIFFSAPTGSEAVTAGIRLAKLYTKRKTLIAFWGGFHGTNGESLAVTSWTAGLKCQHLPMLPDVHFVPFPYCYRCPFGRSYPSCSLQCFDFLKNMLENGFSGACEPAAIILEPVQGEGGIHFPPREYIQELGRIATEKSILLIFDEIQCGMGRTGKMWACEHYGVTPDIMIAAKAIGGAGIPLSAVFYKKELDKFPPGTSAGTFRGNVLGMAGAVGALDFIKEANLLNHVQAMSKVLNKGLNELKDKYEVVGDVRQKGLMAAIEFVKDRETKEPWKEFVDDVLLECLKRGLFVWKAGYYFNVIRLLPPLIITEELINKSITILGEVIGNVVEREGS